VCRYLIQRPHCSVELKRIVAERGRRSRSGHLCFVLRFIMIITGNYHSHHRRRRRHYRYYHNHYIFDRENRPLARNTITDLLTY